MLVKVQLQQLVVHQEQMVHQVIQVEVEHQVLQVKVDNQVQTVQLGLVE